MPDNEGSDQLTRMMLQPMRHNLWSTKTPLMVIE